MRFRDVRLVRHHGEPRTIPALIRDRAGEMPERIALLDGRKSVTYGELGARVAGSARQLRSLGIGRGDRIVMFVTGDAGVDAAMLSMAAASAGTAAVLDASGPAAWRARMIERIRPRLVLLPEGLSSDGITGTMVRYGDGPELLVSGDMTGVDDDGRGEPDPEDIALILASSGTTGEAKLVPIPHRMIMGFGSVVGGIEADDRMLVVGGLFHAMSTWVYCMLSFGASSVIAGLMPPDVLARQCILLQPTIAASAPLLLAAIGDRLAMEATGERTSFRGIITGGAGRPRDVEDRLVRGFRCDLVDLYGASESFCIALDGRHQADRVRISGQDGESLPAGDSGEIQTCGDRTFPGYLDDPDATAAAFTADGWYRTGDLGVVGPDGRLRMLGRLAETINRGGVKISPEAIERVASDHPAVREAAAYPIPHPGLGQEAALAVVLSPGAALPMRDLRRWLLERLPAAQMPHAIRVVDALPRTASGKVARLRLAGQPEPGGPVGSNGAG
jgi:acyl-CoA synthetase (AMP-forming)/AMP-acid ligase II